jgi:SAM-dependent methyltransferase
MSRKTKLPPPESVGPDQFLYSGTELGSMVEARNYYRWLLRYFQPHLKGKVIEIGAGIGTFSRLILNLQDVQQLVAVEPAANLYPLLLQQIGAYARARTLNGYLQDVSEWGTANALLSVNVLEHVEQDQAFLGLAHRALLPGGTCLLFVPAVQGLYGSLDRAFEHFRRYGKRELELKLRDAGFEIELLRYFNFPGVFAWFIAGRVLRQTSLRARQTRYYDRWVVPWLSILERYWEPPVGQSLLAVARKPVEKI